MQKTAPVNIRVQKTTIGERLKEERVRLGMNQADFARVGGASKRTQIVWESGPDEEGKEVTPPAAFLAAVAKLGVDAAYVVTGVRTVPVADALPPREHVLLENYRAASSEGKRAIERAAMLEAQGAATESVNFSVKGHHNVVAGRSIGGDVPAGKDRRKA